MRNDLREHRRSVDSPSMRLCVRLSNCLRHDDLRRNTNAGRDGSAAEVEKGRNEGIAGLRMSEIRFPSLSSMRDIFRFSAFWLAFGLLVGPVVGFLLGARSWRDLWISVQAGLLFTLPLSVMIAATRLIPPRWIGKRPVDDLRGFVRLRAPRSGRSPSRRWRWCALSDEIERRRLQGMISQESRALISRRARCRCPSRCC